MEQKVIADAEPLQASLWRKFLPIRVLILCFVGLGVSWLLVNWLDTVKHDIPNWFAKAVIIGAVLPFFAMFLALRSGLQDLLVHFMPEGRMKQKLLSGRSSKEVAAEFSKSGYSFALLPFILPGLALTALLVVGGFALTSAFFQAIFSGWPPWAIVITFLLIAILLKK